MPKPFYPAAASALVHAALLAFYVAGFGGDPSALVCVDREVIGRWPYETVRVGFETGGYDGQHYYAIARDPWRRHELHNDCAPVRHVRILYPAACWLFSCGGDGYLLLWVMPLVNLLAIAGLAWLGARWAILQGWSGWWGCLLPLAVNAGLPALRNLTDPVSTFTVCGLLLAWLTQRPWWTVALWATSATFAREQNAAVVLIVLGVALWHGRDRTATALFAVLLLWSAWIVALRAMYGEWPLLPSQGNIGLPLSGMLFRWTHLDLSGSRQSALLHALRMLHLTIQLVLAVHLLRRGTDRAVALVALAGAALALIGGTSLYEDAWSYTRVFSWMPLAVWLGYIQARRRWPLILLALAVLWPVVVVMRAWWPGG
jgi:hypothetical protein